jgi:hypothetical protein
MTKPIGKEWHKNKWYVKVINDFSYTKQINNRIIYNISVKIEQKFNSKQLRNNKISFEWKLKLNSQ